MAYWNIDNRSSAHEDKMRSPLRLASLSSTAPRNVALSWRDPNGLQLSTISNVEEQWRRVNGLGLSTVLNFEQGYDRSSIARDGFWAAPEETPLPHRNAQMQPSSHAHETHPQGLVKSAARHHPVDLHDMMDMACARDGLSKPTLPPYRNQLPPSNVTPMLPLSPVELGTWTSLAAISTMAKSEQSTTAEAIESWLQALVIPQTAPPSGQIGLDSGLLTALQQAGQVAPENGGYSCSGAGVEMTTPPPVDQSRREQGPYASPQLPHSTFGDAPTSVPFEVQPKMPDVVKPRDKATASGDRKCTSCRQTKSISHFLKPGHCTVLKTCHHCRTRFTSMKRKGRIDHERAAAANHNRVMRANRASQPPPKRGRCLTEHGSRLARAIESENIGANEIGQHHVSAQIPSARPTSTRTLHLTEAHLDQRCNDTEQQSWQENLHSGHPTERQADQRVNDGLALNAPQPGAGPSRGPAGANMPRDDANVDGSSLHLRDHPGSSGSSGNPRPHTRALIHR